MYDEYLRRNLIVAKAVGVKANTRSALQRLEQQAKPPRWLVLALRGILERAEPLPAELAKWRNTAPDTPEDMRPTLETSAVLTELCSCGTPETALVDGHYVGVCQRCQRPV
jgi:hypothetical protein